MFFVSAGGTGARKSLHGEIQRHLMSQTTVEVSPGVVALRRITALLAVLMAALAGGVVLPASASQLADQSYRVNEGGRFVTAVTIDGQGPFSFVIDSAASRT